MTNPLKKALRGAATAGAELSMENHRANIQAKRDKALQQYQTSERVAGQEHDINMQKLQNEGRAAAGATQGDIQLMNYLQEHGIASTPEEAYNKVREMDTDPTKIIVDIAKGMHAIDDSKPFDAHLKQAEADVKALRERMSPKKTPPAVEPQPAGGPLKPKRGGGIIESAIDHAMNADAGAPAPVAGTQPAVENPPVTGAKKAGDGKWYVQKDGKWFRVD